MGAGQALGLIGIAIVEHGAVVGGENHQGVVGDAQFAQTVHDLPHCPVELYDGVAAQAHGTLAAKTFVRPTRHVHIVGAEIHEEGPVGAVLRLLCGGDPAQGVIGDGVGNVLVFPERFAAALHETDARNAVDDAHVVTVGGAQPEQFGIRFAGGLTGKIAAVAHLDGSRGIVVTHTSVFDEHTGHAVGSGGHDAAVVEPEICGSEVDLSIPVLLRGAATETEVPLADGGSGVAGGFEKIGQGELFGADDHGGVAGGHVGAGATEGVFAREEPVAGGRRGGGTGMGIGEAHTVGGEAVDVGGVYPFGAVAREVAVADIVGHDDQHVGALLGGGQHAHAVAR